MTLCGLLVCGTTACGIVDDSSEPGVVSPRPRWLFLDSEEALTLVEFDDPRKPRLERHLPVEGCCRWTSDGKRMLLLGGTPETAFVADAPDWELSPLPVAEDYDIAYFLNSTHFVARRLDNGEKWVFRNFAGTSFMRFGSEEAKAIHGGVAVLQDEQLVLVRRDMVSVTLPAPGLAFDHLQVRFDADGQHVLLMTWLEDAADFGPLPDFISHIESEASPSCLDSAISCHPAFLSSTSISEADLLIVGYAWPKSDGEDRLLVAISPGEKAKVGPPESTNESVVADWVMGEGAAWVDAPSGRVRWATSDPKAERWTVKERSVLEPDSAWVVIAEGAGSWVDNIYIDFDFGWIELDGIFSALDLASGREPVPVGPVFPRSFGWRRRSLVFEEESPIPCYGPCSYAAYADPSDPDAPVIHGALEAIGDGDYSWAPDESGLLLRSEGWLVYHAFAAPDEPFRLAPISDETRVEIAPQ